MRCYRLLKSVPRGRVTTYGSIARALGSKAYRSVGSAMRKNRNHDIPCHRVVLSDGRVGNYNRGRSLKMKMLKREGVKIVGGRIDLQTHAHKFR